MMWGYHVFHDFPAGRFHIDHIIVGPNGVFTVQSKSIAPSRHQRPEKSGSLDTTIAKPYAAPKFEKQSKRSAAFHASWLGNWFLTAAGEVLRVQPMLPLPGRTNAACEVGEVMVVDPKRIADVVRSTCVNPLPPETIKRLCTEIELKYRRSFSESLRIK